MAILAVHSVTWLILPGKLFLFCMFFLLIFSKGGNTMTFDIMRNESGQGLTEYALIIALVAIVAVAALTLLGGQISAIFGDINGDLGGA
jgi:pilus assembly protein Flp/PilA